MKDYIRKKRKKKERLKAMVIQPLESPRFKRFEDENQTLVFSYAHLEGIDTMNRHNLCVSCSLYTEIPENQCNVLKFIASRNELQNVKFPIWACYLFEASPGETGFITYELYGRTVYVREALFGYEGSHTLCEEPCTVRETCDIYTRLQDARENYGVELPIWECPNFRYEGFVPRRDEV